MKTLIINGAEKQLPAGQLPETLAELLLQFDIEETMVVAEVDGQIVERNKFAQTLLSKCQRIELWRLMVGG